MNGFILRFFSGGEKAQVLAVSSIRLFTIIELFAIEKIALDNESLLLFQYQSNLALQEQQLIYHHYH